MPFRVGGGGAVVAAIEPSAGVKVGRRPPEGLDLDARRRRSNPTERLVGQAVLAGKPR